MKHPRHRGVFLVAAMEYNEGNMTVVLSILGVIAFTVLLLLEAGQPARTTVSLFELRRRKAAKDQKASDILRREELLAQASALKTPLRALLLIGLALLLVYLLGWGKGMAVAVAVGLLYGRIARLTAVRRLASRLHKRREDSLLAFMAQHEGVLRLVAGKASLSQPTAPLGSREELAHLLEVSHIFSSEDRKLLESTLGFGDLTVKDSMVKKSSIITVRPDELLGPLVLDDLHRTKHEIFPVEKDEAIVGMLDIRDHMALRRKESVYVRDVMHNGVVHIAQSEPLDEALRVLVAAKQPYLIVTDDEQRMVGLLGLGDVIRALTGWTRG